MWLTPLGQPLALRGGHSNAPEENQRECGTRTWNRSEPTTVRSAVGVHEWRVADHHVRRRPLRFSAPLQRMLREHRLRSGRPQLAAEHRTSNGASATVQAKRTRRRARLAECGTGRGRTSRSGPQTVGGQQLTVGSREAGINGADTVLKFSSARWGEDHPSQTKLTITTTGP